MDQLQLLRRRLDRETKAREAAEAIVERASRELFVKNQELAASAKRLAMFLPPQLHALLSKTDTLSTLTGRKFLTLVFADIAGFTAMTEGLEPEVVVTTVNDYLNRVVACADKTGGLVDKFMGDGAMVFFGAPESQGHGQDAVAALTFAMDLQREFEELCGQWRAIGVEHKLGLRVGVNSGHCTVGNFGSERRFQFTAMGGTVNIASRMEKLAAPGKVVCTLATANLAKDAFSFQSMGEQRIKGLALPMEAFEVQMPCEVNGAAHAFGPEANLLADLETVLMDRKLAAVVNDLVQKHFRGKRPIAD